VTEIIESFGQPVDVTESIESFGQPVECDQNE